MIVASQTRKAGETTRGGWKTRPISERNLLAKITNLFGVAATKLFPLLTRIRPRKKHPVFFLFLSLSLDGQFGGGGGSHDDKTPLRYGVP